VATKKFVIFAKNKSMLIHYLFSFVHNRLLNSLTHALQSSGVDLSQASISVQINLGKRAVKRPAAGVPSKAPTDPASSDEIGQQLAMLGGGAEDPSHAAKRHKPGNS
jgi:hypothetical protein